MARSRRTKTRLNGDRRGAIHRQTPLAELPELLRVPEVAQWADCSRGAIYDAIKTGTLAHVTIGRLVRVPRTALVAWLEGAR